MAPVKTTGAIVAAISVSMALLSYILCSYTSNKNTRLEISNKKKKKPRNGLIDAVGNTPLIRINSLSQATGCEILGKCEFLNPGGSVKDRVAVKIIEEALESGQLSQGGVVTEGSAGSTAISLATVAPAYGCKCHVVIPDDVAIEKEKNPIIKCFLIDPPGSGLFNKITRGVMYTKEEAEGKRLKNPFDTITEGIGINRITQNFMMAKLDGAFRGTDKEAVEMSRFLLKNDGLFLGSSSAMNCVGAVRVAQAIGPGHTIVTILCDSGMRHLSKFHNAEYLSQHGLTPTATGLEFLGIK
ncbi:cysteine synthase, putative [Ricinus communis]|uniref:cysteine synthase n=1 Tax=Ricinus communis TaxID=3988 RepID=B9S9T9_RICCO|nr:cysteine synthase, putative [Ricinus communis]